MAKPPITKPHANVQLTERNGVPSAVWYSVFDKMVQTINDLQRRVEELENP